MHAVRQRLGGSSSLVRMLQCPVPATIEEVVGTPPPIMLMNEVFPAPGWPTT